MTKAERAHRLMKKTGGMVRTKGVCSHGIAVVCLRRLAHDGDVVQSARGIYQAADHRPSPHHRLAEATKRIPRGAVGLLSALANQDLTREAPTEVWMAIDRKERLSSMANLEIRFVRFSGAALDEGVEGHAIQGVLVRVTSYTKTAVDLFLKCRNKLYLTLALDAVRDCLRKQKCLMDGMWWFAVVCLVETVIRPYLEALS